MNKCPSEHHASMCSQMPKGSETQDFLIKPVALLWRNNPKKSRMIQAESPRLNPENLAGFSSGCACVCGWLVVSCGTGGGVGRGWVTGGCEKPPRVSRKLPPQSRSAPLAEIIRAVLTPSVSAGSGSNAAVSCCSSIRPDAARRSSGLSSQPPPPPCQFSTWQGLHASHPHHPTRGGEKKQFHLALHDTSTHPFASTLIAASSF